MRPIHFLAAGAIVVAGCSEPLEPEGGVRQAAVTVAAGVTQGDAGARAGALVAVSDALDRVVPTLDVDAARALALALRRVHDGVAAGDAPSTSAAIALARQGADRLAASTAGGGSGAEIDAIRLALAQAEAGLLR